MEQQELIPANGQLVKADPTPMDLLQMAVQKGVDIDQLAKLMELKERWEAREAKKAFDDAMAEFKKHPPTIVKNKHVKFGNTEYDHATLDQVTDGITGALSALGLRHKWDTAQAGTEISVTCVISGFGHEERTTLKASADNSGSKNPIQSIGSAVTYLQRYTLLLACGMAAKGQDDDGKASGLGPDWTAEHCEWLMNCRNPSELQRLFATYYKEARAVGDKDAMTALITAKDKRKLEFAA